MSLDIHLVGTDYFGNITHNLNTMAAKAGIYELLWWPDEIGIKKAKYLIPGLMKGLEWLLLNKKKAEKYNPENGWGNYDNLVHFVMNYIIACSENPNATINVSR